MRPIDVVRYARTISSAAKRGAARHGVERDDVEQQAACILLALGPRPDGPWSSYIKTATRRAAGGLARDRRHGSWREYRRYGRRRDRVCDGRPSEEVRIDVEAAMDALPAADRELLRMAYWRDMSHREIGRRLGVHARTVSLRLGRIAAVLAPALASYCPEAAALADEAAAARPKTVRADKVAKALAARAARAAAGAEAARVRDEWTSGRHASRYELAAALGVDYPYVVRMLDRHRRRVERGKAAP